MCDKETQSTRQIVKEIESLNVFEMTQMINVGFTIKLSINGISCHSHQIHVIFAEQKVRSLCVLVFYSCVCFLQVGPHLKSKHE